jgi:hypothetical protein
MYGGLTKVFHAGAENNVSNLSASPLLPALFSQPGEFRSFRVLSIVPYQMFHQTFPPSNAVFFIHMFLFGH